MKKERELTRNFSGNLERTKIFKKEVYIKDSEDKEYLLGIYNERSIPWQYDRGFYKLWTINVNINKRKIDKTEVLIMLFFWIIDKMNKNNRLIIEFTELAKLFKTTRQTISNHIKKLEKLNILMYKNKIIFVNPHVVYKGDARWRQDVKSDYNRGYFMER